MLLGQIRHLWLGTIALVDRFSSEENFEKPKQQQQQKRGKNFSFIFFIFHQYCIDASKVETEKGKSRANKTSVKQFS